MPAHVQHAQVLAAPAGAQLLQRDQQGVLEEVAVRDKQFVSTVWQYLHDDVLSVDTRGGQSQRILANYARDIIVTIECINAGAFSVLLIS